MNWGAVSVWGRQARWYKKASDRFEDHWLGHVMDALSDQIEDKAEEFAKQRGHRRVTVEDVEDAFTEFCENHGVEH